MLMLMIKTIEEHRASVIIKLPKSVIRQLNRWRRTHSSQAKARRDVFDYVEMFHNPKRKHTKNGMLSPVEFERQQETITEGVSKIPGYSVRLPTAG